MHMCSYVNIVYIYNFINQLHIAGSFRCMSEGRSVCIDLLRTMLMSISAYSEQCLCPSRLHPLSVPRDKQSRLTLVSMQSYRLTYCFSDSPPRSWLDRATDASSIYRILISQCSVNVTGILAGSLCFTYLVNICSGMFHISDPCVQNNVQVYSQFTYIEIYIYTSMYKDII